MFKQLRASCSRAMFLSLYLKVCLVVVWINSGGKTKYGYSLRYLYDWNLNLGRRAKQNQNFVLYLTSPKNSNDKKNY